MRLAEVWAVNDSAVRPWPMASYLFRLFKAKLLQLICFPKLIGHCHSPTFGKPVLVALPRKLAPMLLWVSRNRPFISLVWFQCALANLESNEADIFYHRS